MCEALRGNGAGLIGWMIWAVHGQTEFFISLFGIAACLKITMPILERGVVTGRRSEGSGELFLLIWFYVFVCRDAF